jgi:SAM-dependent methyltransferase
MKPKTLFRLLSRSGKLISALLAMRNQEILPTRQHLRLCADWFLYCQRVSRNGGYAASYSLITGMRHPYIETTGYIVPTMFDLAVTLNDARYRESALDAGEWLLAVQDQNGAFTDIDHHEPQVFDTGQVMLGLNRLYRETKDRRYLESTRRAADWVTKMQDADGSWATMAYHRGQPASYHTRVAAAVIEASQLIGESRYRDCAEKNLLWAATRQQASGFFLNSELSPGANPVSHTIVYVLEGFLKAFQLTGDQRWLDVLLRGAEPVKRVMLERDLLLRSQYDANWNVTNPEKCIPGVAQWAGLCLNLHELTREADWLEAAQLCIYYLKSKQLRGAGILHGALPASVPIWGEYHPMMFPNWAVKFFADALLLYEKHGFAVWEEQEAWVKKCFELRLDGGGWSAHSKKMEPFDELICARISEELKPLRDGAVVMDLGCGEGRYLHHLKAQFPKLEFMGVDPCAAEGDGQIHRGSACRIPMADGSVDAAYTWIVLQHVADLAQALREVRRVLKPGGVLFIGDRNLFSGRGLSKPWHELNGRWIYPWDSPFRERWYFAGGWKRALESAGFRAMSCRSVIGRGEHGWRRLARMNGFLLVTAQKR